MRRELKHLLVSSNALFLIPLALSIYLGIYLHAISIVICIIGSVLYHKNQEKRLGLADRYSAIQLIFMNVLLVAIGGFKPIYAFSIILLIILAFWFKKLGERRDYTLWHSMWHITSVLITIVSILSYKTFY
jgi:hypothetical protein